MHARYQTEIEDLHRFFESWLSGRAGDDDATWERLPSVLAEDFAHVGPDGALLDREGLLSALRPAHGSAGGSFRIRIEDVRCRLVEGDLGLTTYEEWQDRSGRLRGMLSTALFRARPGAPNGLEWVHVHETWLADGWSG